MEFKDEWRCWGEQKTTFCIQKSQVFGLLLQK